MVSAATRPRAVTFPRSKSQSRSSESSSFSARTSLELAELVEFLETLTDPCVVDRAYLAPWVADPVLHDVDGHLLVAIDGNGELL